VLRIGIAGDLLGARPDAVMLMDDLRQRLVNRVQLTTDGHKAYLSALEEAFGADIALCGTVAASCFG
jgi:hypothetical protein